jgi:hypothetical protein
LNPFSGKLYIFKGDKYLRYDWLNDATDPDYPKKISEHWHGLPSGFTASFDAALEGDKGFAGKGYFFKGNLYIRYNWDGDYTEP